MRQPTPAVPRISDPRSRGQALVEFALVLVPLMFLLLGAIDLGRVFLADITIGNAARAGAMQAAITPASFSTSDCTSANYATNLVVCAVQNETGQRNAGSTDLTVTAADISVTCKGPGGAVTCPSSPQQGVRSSVTVAVQFALITPLLQALFGSQTLALSSTATADQESLPSPAAPAASPTPAPTACIPPTISFTGSPTDGVKSQTTMTVTFTATSTGNPTSWSWDFGDGTTATTPTTVTHTYAYSHGNGKQQWSVSVTAGTGANCSAASTRNNYISLNP